MSRAGKTSLVDPLAALAAAPPTNPRFKVCLVVRALGALDDQRAASLRYLIDESEHTAGRISRACQDAGVSLSVPAVQRHRRKDCQCPA